MPIRYKAIGFSYEEHKKYAQLCKIVRMYAPWSNYCNKLHWEMEKLLAHEGYKIDFCRGRRHPPEEGNYYSPYLEGPDPVLPIYSLDECYKELHLLITNLETSDAPTCATNAIKYAHKAIEHLQRSSRTKYFPQYIKWVNKLNPNNIVNNECK